MLVPAMAFAWWLVSIPNPPPSHRAAVQAADDSTTPEIAGGTQQVASASATANEGSGGTDENAGGERVTLKVVSPEIVRVAKTFLDLPMGAERTVSIDGRRYVFVLERHYHPPGFVGAPNGWHKGVTVYGLR